LRAKNASTSGGISPLACCARSMRWRF
jgi:hypothetical protein